MRSALETTRAQENTLVARSNNAGKDGMQIQDLDHTGNTLDRIVSLSAISCPQSVFFLGPEATQRNDACLQL